MTADDPDASADAADAPGDGGMADAADAPGDGGMADAADAPGDGRMADAADAPGDGRMADAAGSSTKGAAQTGRPDVLEVPDRVDWRGWILVAIVVFSFVIVPVFVFYIPEMHSFIGALGFSQRQAYILFPMLPALLLGLTAVWVALRTHSS